MKLFAGQQAGVEKFLNTPFPHRLLFGFDTGCGKTPTAITCVSEVMDFWAAMERVLIVCPAIGRRHWRAEFAKWWPDHPELGLIEFGRKREAITEKAKLEREAAYKAPIQVSSFDLIGEVDPLGWDFIIIDEAHHLQHPTSKQSKLVRTLCRANPKACILLLSATPIPTEIRGLWHPLHLAWPDKWGAMPGNGKEAYSFLERYCHKELSDAGYTTYFGFREDRREEFVKRLEPYIHRLTREDIKADLPPLDVSPLYLDAGQTPDKVVLKWAENLGQSVTHFGVFTYYREAAEQVAEALRDAYPGYRVEVITGEMDAGKRFELLDTLRGENRAILVGTTESLRESIRLMWVQHALVLEWRTSPSQVTQFLGRFNSVGHDGAPPGVKIAIGPDDVQHSRKLFRRMADINDVLRNSKSDQNISAAFTERQRTETEWDDMFSQMLASVNTGRLDWEGDTEDE